jgi:hypothetical protein
MDLIDRLMELSSRVAKITDQCLTEEAAKNALVLPFINALGYNVFDPLEVIPEFTADVGIKKGEKVDYAIMRDGKPILLFECKGSRADLRKEHASQLYRYFSVTEARFGILTNGVAYMVYSDLDSPNKMDDRPFLEFSILEVDQEIADQLRKFTKDKFNVDDILITASDLKYTKGIQRVLTEEWVNPSEEFVRLFAGRVYQGRLTQTTKEQFTEIVRRAFHQFVNAKLNERLKSALTATPLPSPTTVVTTTPEEVSTDDSLDVPKVVTTDEELEAFYVVKAIVREVISAERIFMRDTQSYCGVLIDDNNRKPLCRLFFNTAQRYIGLIDAEKNVSRHAITGLNDIYSFADQLKATAKLYVRDESVESPPGN